MYIFIICQVIKYCFSPIPELSKLKNIQKYVQETLIKSRKFPAITYIVSMIRFKLILKIQNLLNRVTIPCSFPFSFFVFFIGPKIRFTNKKKLSFTFFLTLHFMLLCRAVLCIQGFLEIEASKTNVMARLKHVKNNCSYKWME